MCSYNIINSNSISVDTTAGQRVYTRTPICPYLTVHASVNGDIFPLKAAMNVALGGEVVHGIHYFSGEPQ